MNYMNSIPWIISSTIIVWFLNTMPVQALKISPEQVAAHQFFQIGIEQIQLSDYSKALHYFDRAIQINPNSAEAYRGCCWVDIQTENYAKATIDCQKAIDLNKNDIESYLNLGIAYYRNNNFNLATSTYNQLIQQYPDEARGYYDRALVSVDKKDYLTAISDYNQALKLSQPLENTEIAEIYIDRGVAYLLNQETSKAMSDFSTAIAINPNNYRAYYNRGCSCSHQGEIKNAIQDFNTALSLDPFYAQAYLSRGKLYQQQRLYALALADFNQATQYFFQQGNQKQYLQAISLTKILQQWLASTMLNFLT